MNADTPHSFADSGLPFAPSAPFALNIHGFHSSLVFTFNLAPCLSRSRGTRKRGTPAMRAFFTISDFVKRNFKIRLKQGGKVHF